MATLTSPATEILADIQNTNKLLSDALARKSAEDMAALYTAEGMLLPAGREPIQGRDGICNYWKSAIDNGISKVNLKTLDLELLNDTAIELGQYVLMNADSQQLDRGKYVVVWKQRAGQWKLHKDIWNTSLT